MAVIHAGGPVRGHVPVQAGSGQPNARLKKGVVKGRQIGAATDGLGQFIAGVATEVEVLNAAIDAALLVQRVGGPGQVGGNARIERQRRRVAVHVGMAVGFTFFVHGVQAIAKCVVRPDPAARVHMLAVHAIGAHARVNTQRGLVSRLFGDKVDHPARRTKPVHKARSALKQLHGIKGLQRQFDGGHVNRQAVDLVAAAVIQRQAAHADGVSVQRKGIAVGHHRGVFGKHLAQRLDLTFFNLGTADLARRKWRIQLTGTAQRPGNDLWLLNLLPGDGHGFQLWSG